MVATAITRQLRSNKHPRLLLQLNQFSSSSSNSDDNRQNETPLSPSPSKSQSQSSSFSSYFRDVKSSLKQIDPSPLQPRRPSLIGSSPGAGDAPTRNVDSLEDIRKNLSEFPLRSSVQPPSSSPTISFQELYKRNVLPQADPGSSSEGASKMVPPSLKAMRWSLRNQRTSRTQSQQSEAPGNSVIFDDIRQSLKLRPQSSNRKAPESIGKDKKEMVSDEMKVEFVRTFSFGELGDKLRKLRPEVKGNKKNWFSLGELNERLRKMRQIEEKENQNRGGFGFRELRESLFSMQISKDEKKFNSNAAIGDPMLATCLVYVCFQHGIHELEELAL